MKMADDNPKTSSEKVRKTLEVRHDGDPLFRISDPQKEQSDQVVFITDEVYKED